MIFPCHKPKLASTNNEMHHDFNAVGYIFSVFFLFHCQLYEPLLRGPKLRCPLKKHEYPFMMRFDEVSNLLLVCTRRFVYLIHTAIHDIIGAFASTTEDITWYVHILCLIFIILPTFSDISPLILLQNEIFTFIFIPLLAKLL